MHSPIDLYNRQDKLSAERLLLERLEYILHKEFIGRYSPNIYEVMSNGPLNNELDDAYSEGAQEVKRYLRDTLSIYCVERNLYDK